MPKTNTRLLSIATKWGDILTDGEKLEITLSYLAAHDPEWMQYTVDKFQELLEGAWEEMKRDPSFNEIDR